MKKMILPLVLACTMGASAFGQAKDSVLVLFEMVEALQKQQQAWMGQQKMITFLMEKSRQDSLRILELSKQVQSSSSDQTERMLDQATQVEAIKQQRTQDSRQLQVLQDSMMRTQERLFFAMQTINGYKQEIGELQTKQSSFSEVQTRMRVADEVRYLHIKNNLLHTASLYELMNERIYNLMAFEQLGSYESLLVELNNPANPSLGFSYNAEVIKLLEKEVFAKERDRDKLLRFAKIIVENPVAQGIKSLMPVVGVANSILSFVTGISLERKDITEESLVKFKSDLERYTEYYAKLNDSNAKFRIIASTYRSDLVAVQLRLREQAMFNGTSCAIKLKKPEEFREKDGDYLLYLFKEYNRSFMENYFKGLEARHTKNGALDYASLLQNTELSSMYNRTEDAMMLYRDFEKVYEQYLKILDENNGEVANILRQADKAKIGNSVSIKSVIDKLDSEKLKTAEAIRRSINLEKLTAEAQRLSKYPPNI